MRFGHSLRPLISHGCNLPTCVSSTHALHVCGHKALTVPETSTRAAKFCGTRPSQPLSPPLAGLLRPLDTRLGKGEYLVLGDNAETSVDSRCWGALPAADLAGRPLMRVLPMDRAGPVK